MSRVPVRKCVIVVVIVVVVVVVAVPWYNKNIAFLLVFFSKRQK